MKLEARIERVYRRAPPWAVWAGAAALLLIVGGRGIGTAARNWWELRRAQGEVGALEREGAELSVRLKRLKTDDSHLERVARKELGLMKPGEVEYRFGPSR